ncbi:unnamed protein product [Gongylonema pulchrum]|uniref:Uncharacterized protein n=1 Tax=Gongylonema pulchrum TaxID=637853 RepID=A0A183DC80_9BILA|nr:unnamed protein product [Gongylonema pulchrum]
MHWKYIALTVCAYGVIKKFRPATPFLTPYLLSPYKNFTDVQLYSQIYPLWCYSYLIALIPIFFLTDILRYRPIVMLEATSFCATSAILIWGTTLWQMQLMQICYGLFCTNQSQKASVFEKPEADFRISMIFFDNVCPSIAGVSTASEIAYFSLMYVIVDQKHFKRITSYLRTATLVGKFLAYGLAQFLVSFHIGSYLLLNQVRSAEL